MIGPTKGSLRLLRNFYLTLFLINQVLHAMLLTSKGCFLPLTASITLEVKSDHAAHPCYNPKNFEQIHRG